MLEGLDRVDWAQLHHAYGPASDVPDQLRALAAADAERRKDARWRLYGSIYHQGSRWQASAHAVPFLLELLADPGVPERDEILFLLVALALGDAEAYLPHGFDRAAQAAAFAGAAEVDGLPGAEDVVRRFYADRADVTDAQRDVLRRLPARWRCDTYLAAGAGVATFRALLVDPEPAVRIAAGYALAWFPDGAAGSLAAVRHILGGAWGGARDDGRRPGRDEPARAERANLVLAAGLLARYTADTTDTPALEPLLEGGADDLLAVAAALALEAALDGAPPPQAVRVLTGAVAAGERAQEAGRDLPWNGGDLVGYAGVALQAVRSRHHEGLEESVELAAYVERIPS